MDAWLCGGAPVRTYVGARDRVRRSEEEEKKSLSDNGEVTCR